MPRDAYYSGHGRSVMKSMKAQYGEKKGEQVFHATANKRAKTAAGGRKGRKRHE